MPRGLSFCRATPGLHNLFHPLAQPLAFSRAASSGTVQPLLKKQKEDSDAWTRLTLSALKGEGLKNHQSLNMHNDHLDRLIHDLLSEGLKQVGR